MDIVLPWIKIVITITTKPEKDYKNLPNFLLWFIVFCCALYGSLKLLFAMNMEKKSNIHLFTCGLSTQPSSFLKIDYAGLTKKYVSGCSLGQKFKEPPLLYFGQSAGILLIFLLLNYHNPVGFVAITVCDLWSLGFYFIYCIKYNVLSVTYSSKIVSMCIDF